MAATVLLVEDERKLRELVRSYLEGAGFAVLSTESGAEALTLAASAPVDLVVLDLGLPDVAGETVARELRAARPTPILMLTAKGAEEDRIHGLELGADDYVTKPFSPRELVLRVQAILRRGAGGPSAGPGPASYGGGVLVIEPSRWAWRVFIESPHRMRTLTTPRRYHRLMAQQQAREVAMSVRRVFAGVSGSRRCLPALRYAAGLAEEQHAVLFPLLIWTPPGGELADRRSPSIHLRMAWEEAARQRLRDALTAAFGGEPAGVTTRQLVVRGDPGWVLVHAAAKAGDLLVVGTGRQGQLARLAGGKVSRYCLAHAACPVIAVPPSPLELHAGSGLNTWMFWHRGLKELTAVAGSTSAGKPGPR